MQNERLIQSVQNATRKLASSGNFDMLLKDVLAICVDAVGASQGTIYLHDPATKRLRFRHVLPESIEDKLPTKDIAEDFGLAGEAFTTRKTICREFPPKSDDQRNAFEAATGVTIRNMIAAPLNMETEEPIGVVQLLNKHDGDFNENDRAVLDIVGAVATMAFYNARLTEESVRASSLLGMGKVSHDIGNLAAALHANLTFADLAIRNLSELLARSSVEPNARTYVGLLGDTVNDLHTSVEEIVRYSRLMSDLSAGKPLRPQMKNAPMAPTIRAALTHVESDARASHVAVHYDLDDEAPSTMHDELYISRIVQNLVGNALKAVRETVPDGPNALPTGDVWVRYYFEDGTHIVEVKDTGPGMSRTTVEQILSGNARSQWDKGSGSGWGTKIVLELAATHDGQVEIDSEPGSGTTFRVRMPQRADA